MKESQGRRQQLIGHRGAGGLAPENTIAAFKKGVEVDVDLLECDIHLSKDRQLVVIHDNTLDRTTSGSGWIKDKTLEELRELDAGEGERIPTLQEVAAVARESGKGLIVEIKGESHETANDTAKALAEFIDKGDVPEELMVISFWHSLLKRFPDVKTGVLISQDEDGLPETMIKKAQNVGADVLGVKDDFISKELVDKAHEGDLEVNAWTLDNPTEFEDIKAMDVDYLTTNFPDRLKV